MNRRCVIIGSGLGGLSCAAVLARNGYDVTVLEQGVQAGGCLQCFHRGGVKFETGMHFIGSAGEGETVGKLMRYLEMDDVRLSPLDKEGYDVVSLDGETFRFANGRDPFIQRMAGYFPDQTDNLVRYYDIVEEIAGASSLHSLRYADTGDMVNVHYQTVSIDSVLDEVIGDPLLRNVLVGNLPLYDARRGETPFSQHAFIMDFYNRSSFRIVGGSDAITRSLTATIGKYGGCVRTRSKVTRILCDDTKATGVEVNGSEFIPADVVISAVHPGITMRMVDGKLLRPAFRRRLIEMPNTIGAFSVYLKFKPGRMPYMNSNFYGFRDCSPWESRDYTAGTWPKGYLYMHLCHEERPVNAGSGIILSYMRYDDVARWNNGRIGHRGADYESFKKRMAERLLDAVERDFPGIRDSIESYYTSTPLTYLDYTGTFEGSMYGVAKSISLGAAARVPHRTRIPNLLLSGQNVNSHGMLGVLVGTIVTCSELLTAREIYDQINLSNS